MISSAVTLQLPALQVALPLISAPLGLLLRRHRLVWALAVVVCWASLAIAWLLLQQVLAQGTISYAMGGWAAPWGIEYRIDAVNGPIGPGEPVDIDPHRDGGIEFPDEGADIGDGLGERKAAEINPALHYRVIDDHIASPHPVRRLDKIDVGVTDHFGKLFR